MIWYNSCPSKVRTGRCAEDMIQCDTVADYKDINTKFLKLSSYSLRLLHPLKFHAAHHRYGLHQEIKYRV